MLKNLKHKAVFLTAVLFSFSSCASTVDWKGDLSTHSENYMQSLATFRKKVCVPRAEPLFEEYLKSYRGQGYWIPELNGDVDVDSIKLVLPQIEKKLAWISSEKLKLQKGKVPSGDVTHKTRALLKALLELKKTELSKDEKAKVKARQVSLKLLEQLEKSFGSLVNKVSFFSNFSYPVDHLKNRKIYDEVKDKEDEASIKKANATFLLRKTLEDGAYNKDHTGSDIYLRTTLDTLHYELKEHGFYLTEDARYDLEFVLDKIEAELRRGKVKLVERLGEWENRTKKAVDFYRSLTLPENQLPIKIGDETTTRNRQLIKEHNFATHRLKKFVYSKQAEVYNYWLNQTELTKAIFVLETILLNEVGGVDGDDALERMDVARVVINRLDKPQYLSIGKKEHIYPYLQEVTSESNIQSEKWLNALFKQGEFSFTYYYMSGVAKIFCPDISPLAKRLREKNVQIALQVLKEGKTPFQTTRYFSRSSMIGRIHMDSVWEDYAVYPERPGLLASGQKKLLNAFNKGEYTYLYSFKDPEFETFQVIEIDGRTYALGEKKGTKIFYSYRNPHYFKYFTKIEK